jgi:hypothetical protein
MVVGGCAVARHPLGHHSNGRGYVCTHTQLANKEERLSSVVGQPNNKMGPFHFTGAKQFQFVVIFPPLSFLNHFTRFVSLQIDTHRK